MTTLKIGPDGDIFTTKTGQIARVDGVGMVAQKIQTRLKLLLGEWFVDLNEGLPWFQQILEKGPSNNARLAILKRAILETDGVLGLDSLSIDDFQAADRVLEISFTARTQAGTVSSSVTF